MSTPRQAAGFLALTCGKFTVKVNWIVDKTIDELAIGCMPTVKLAGKKI
jgi:hypothetical protein